MVKRSIAVKQRTPIYEGIKQLLKGRIERGELAVGDRIPSEFELAEQLGVSRSQTRPALRELQLEGYLIRKQGSGSYVAPVSNRTPSVRVAGTQTVAIVIPQEIYGHANNIVQGFMHRMADQSRQVITYNLNIRRPDDASEVQCLRSVVASGVAGIAAWVVNNDGQTREYVQELAERAFPVVLLDRNLPGVDTDFVVTDNKKLGYDLTSALLDRGHRRIGFAGIEHPESSSVQERLAGYRQAIKEASIAFDARLVMRIEDMENAATAVMALRDEPTAFVCTFEEPLDLLSQQLEALGYRLGEDIDVAVVTDYPPGLPNVPLITAPQQGFEIGATAADLLLARIEDPGRTTSGRRVNPGILVDTSSHKPMQAATAS